MAASNGIFEYEDALSAPNDYCSPAYDISLMKIAISFFYGNREVESEESCKQILGPTDRNHI